MRVDKFLWCVRYFKTRNQATEACKKGQVRINDTIAKPGKEVYISDHLIVRKNQINYQLKVLDIPKSRLGAKLVDIYRQDVTPSEELETKNLLKLAKDHYRKKGLGRPTKKDRRDITDFTDWDDK
ncbi:RNA-binding S4 domain-containing protein [Winogradskyella aurantiaca]|uniref:RNA-binding S4 domain-containing protein n=1 Tax=Winogradskyella aurantiaca TaxID=2219558 RepID=UPI000E1D5EA1|nr:RNA-binding S4 domain-containing protein [Winogradskyella aurantiaca]